MQTRFLTNGSCGSASGRGIHEYGDWGVDDGDQKQI
jgi:hypothetical protein